MVVKKPSFGQKELRTLLATVTAFILFAASAIGYMLSRSILLLIPLIIFGITGLVFLAWYFGLAIKSVKQEVNKKKEEKPVEKKEPVATKT